MSTQPTTPAKARRKNGLSLRLKLTLLAVAISAVPMAVVGFLLIDVNEDALETSLREHFFTIIDSVSADVEGAVSLTESELNVVAMTLANTSLSEENRIELIRGQVSALRSLKWVAIYDASGARVDVVSSGGEVNAPAALVGALRQQAIENGRAIGTPTRGERLPEALVVVPMRGAAATWFVATQMSLEIAQEAIERFVDRRFLEDNYSIYVVDEKLRAVAHSNRELALDLADVSAAPALTLVSEGALDNGVVLFRDRLGSGEDEVVVALSSLNSVPWALVVEIPRSVAYRSFSRMRVSVVVVVLAIILLATIAAVFFARRITKPISTLVGFANDLAARRFRRVDLKTRDEISILGDALSDAAIELAASDEAIRKEAAIRADMGRYLPSQIVEQIVRREARLSLGGERREITVLFADVANFTPLVEKHAAEDVVTLLNELFTILTEIIFRHNGTVDKFIGDCVMAFWGAPNAQPDHAKHAVAAAEEMIRWLEVGNESWRERFGISIQLAIGVHSGEAVVGNFGSESRMEYTAIGDVVNVAARLETRARPQQILLSRATREAVGSDATFAELGSHHLAGRSEPIDLFEVRGL